MLVLMRGVKLLDFHPQHFVTRFASAAATRNVKDFSCCHLKLHTLLNSCLLFAQLLGNIVQWEGILSYSCLKDLALDSTLNRYILSALQTTDIGEENVQKCQKVR